MRAFFLRHKKLHIWLLAAGAVLAGFYLFRGKRDWMNGLERYVSGPIRRRMGDLCYRTDVSVMEVLYVLAAVTCVLYVVWSAAAVVRARGRRWDRAYSAVLGAACALVTVYGTFWLLWGICFWTDSFQDRSGIYAQPVERADLLAVTERFAEELARAADRVPRDEAGLFAVPREEILERSREVYRGVEEDFPFLAFPDRGVKAMAFSRLMSAMDFTGFYCAYTGESNVNVDSPACLLPSTAAHELAHQRGIASEQECNFLAVLASTRSGDPAYVYSGWLMGYIYLSNALYGADPERYWAVRETLPETVLADLADNNAYWSRFRGTPVQKLSNKVYDELLKGYGETRGIQSYGTVVDLLVAYYT